MTFMLLNDLSDPCIDPADLPSRWPPRDAGTEEAASSGSSCAEMEITSDFDRG